MENRECRGKVTLGKIGIWEIGKETMQNIGNIRKICMIVIILRKTLILKF